MRIKEILHLQTGYDLVTTEQLATQDKYGRLLMDDYQLVRDLGEYGTELDIYKTITEIEGDQHIDATTLALTDTRIVELSVDCEKCGRFWIPSSAKGKLKHTVHLRASYKPGWENRIILGEEQHLSDHREWVKNSGRSVVEDFINNGRCSRAHRHRTESDCVLKEAKKLRSEILGDLSKCSAASMLKYDKGTNPPHKVDY